MLRVILPTRVKLCDILMIKDSTDWEMDISQLSVVLGLMFLAVLVNLGFLLRAYKAHRLVLISCIAISS